MPPDQAKTEVTYLQRETLALAVKPTKSFYAFARALWAAHNEDRTVLHQVERVAGIKRRALFYLLNVGEFLTAYRVTRPQAERIGWTKIRIVAHYADRRPHKINQRTVEACLRLALQTPAHALPDALEKQGEPSRGPLRSVLLRLSAEQYADVEAALIACGAEKKGRGLIGKEAALARLATNHLATVR